MRCWVTWDHRAEGARIEAEWQTMFDGYAAQYPELAAELKRRLAGDLPENWSDTVMVYFAILLTGCGIWATYKTMFIAENCANPPETGTPVSHTTTRLYENKL